MITARQLSKHYRVKVRDPGIGGALRAIVAPRYDDVIAVDKLTFTIERGEVVAFLGPNGAGKTTTLKMITGLLYPTSGSIEVAGLNPWTASAAFKCRISLVLGNKQQLLWDLPVEETFRLNRAIYAIPDAIYAKQRRDLIEMLEIGELLDRPVRNLSLGERMKCELAAALLHRPELVLLDEPTLGLDVTAQDAVRGFLKDYAVRHTATILLTSHYMADVTALAKRVMMINDGRLVYDGSLSDLVARTVPVKRLELTLCPETTLDAVAHFGEVKRFQHPSAVIEVPRDEAARASARILMSGLVVDLSIHDPPIEDVIRQAFADARDDGMTPE
ncbi:MAG TPA: ATP-binding cassette domain-containing protein [Gemmatimonadaceae bacterium]|nr:ATP-binding cassette domain-containing protein [Gemmatimonadaceae bacterium]